MENLRKQSSCVNVIVIGAGVSGLSAAHHLLKTDSNLTFTVLEAKGRIGGRTYGQEMKTVNGTDMFDLGGQWVGRCQPHVMELLEELSLEVYPQYITGKKVMQLGSTKIDTYRSTIPSLSWFSLLDLYFFLSKLERWRKQIPIDDPASCPYAKDWDSMTYEQALRKYVWTKATRHAIEATGRCMFGVEPKDMSFLYFLYYAQAAGGVEKLISSEEGMGNEYKVKGGSFQICERLCEKIGKEKILLNHAVTEITQEHDKVLVKTNQGTTLVCDRVIIALPPHQSAKIEYTPALPVDKIYVLQRMPVGYLTKIVVTYAKPFWRENGYSGEHVSNGGVSRHGQCKSGPLNIGFDATTHNGNPALVTFIGGDQQREYAKLQPDERKASVLQSLTDFFGAEALDCIDYAEKNWNEEPYNGGCPVSVATPGVISLIAPGLRHPFQRLHFAGTESATVWCGFLSGAVQAGQRAANEVLYNIRPSAISAKHLEDTYYNMCDTNRLPKTTLKTSRIFRLLVPLTGVVLAAVVFRKMFFVFGCKISSS